MGHPSFGEDSEGIESIAIADGDDAIVYFTPIQIRAQDSISVQLIADLVGRYIQVEDTDHVVASTKTWTFAEGGFIAGDVGDTFTVTGSASNDGTYTIASRTNARVVVTTEAPGGDETFDPEVEVFLENTDFDPLTGTWAVQVSNNYVPAASGGVYGQPQNGTVQNRVVWTDITTQFSPSISSVTAPQTQYVQADLSARAIRFAFAPSGTSGQAGTMTIQVFAKSWS